MLFESIPEKWQQHLSSHRDVVNQIGVKLQDLANAGERILPDKKWVFRALEIDPEDVKVLVIGQDPYPNVQDACGLAFSVQPRKSGLPGSLMNIQKEILTDIGFTNTADGDLTRWSNQGVMLLNRVLTVTAGASGSHAKWGWEPVTETIARVCGESGAIGLLWGNSARELASLFPPERLVEGIHPSPLSAHRGFLGSKPFSKVNSLLEKIGKQTISW
ncbi:MAG: uracil-DNA glycosylase [Actinobacteria bacterium]|nr:uracil-DNA glycosylase [Actinomycetota bacterium]